MNELELCPSGPRTTIEATGGPVLESAPDGATLTPGRPAATVEPGVQPVVRLEQAPLTRGGMDIVGVGPQGIQGIPGSGGDKTFTTTFGATSPVVIPHNLGKRPAVMVMDSTGRKVDCSMNFPDVNTVVLTPTIPFGGSVTCN